MAQRFQKAAIAMLLCAPSQLHQKWQSKNSTAINEELDRLGFSDPAKAAAIQTMSNLDPVLDVFAVIARRLLDDPWDGVEPHPIPDDDREIVLAMRGLDNE